MEQAVLSEQGTILVILNPVAGTSTPADVRRALDAAFGPNGRQYNIFETTGNDDDIAAQVEQAKRDGCSLIVAAGGDGTVSLVANVMQGSGIPLGILPVGTANVLALELGIPQDLQQAVALFVGEHRIRELDMMKLGNRYFILQIGIGLDSLMIKDTSRKAKRLFGRLAYMATLVGKLFGYQSQRFTMLIDGKRMRPRAWQILVANAGTLGIPPLRWGPDIYPSDGELDLCIFNVRMPKDYVSLLWHLLTGQHKRSPNVTYKRIHKQAIISTDNPLPVQADGEIVGETPVQITVVPHGIKVVVPLEDTSETSPIKIAQEVDERMSDNTNGTGDQKPVQETKSALKEAISTVKTPEQADAVIDELERTAAGKTEHEVGQEQPGTPDVQQAAEAIKQAADTPPEQKPQAVITETAKQIAASEDEDRLELAQAVKEAINPEAEAVKEPETEEERRLLQEALLRRLTPLQAADAAVFLAVNRMPHVKVVNTFMRVLTTIMNRGDGWVIFLVIATLFDRKRGRRALFDVLPPLWLETASVEFPIKSVFRRRRPFISLVRAIVVGKKPGGYSFPSGHSAAAFGGAWLLSQHYPRLRPMFYIIAALTAFSRVYLGVHYPGDVLTGGVTGTTLAIVYNRLIKELTEALD